MVIVCWRETSAFYTPTSTIHWNGLSQKGTDPRVRLVFFSWYNSGIGLAAERCQFVIFLVAGRTNPSVLKGDIGILSQHLPQTFYFSHMARRLDINGCGFGLAIQWCHDFCMTVSPGLYDLKMLTSTGHQDKRKGKRRRWYQWSWCCLPGKLKSCSRFTFNS